MYIDELPYYLQYLTISGREKDEEGDGAEGDGDEGDEHDDDGEEGEDEGSQGGSDSGDGEGEDLSAKVDALEKALRDERKLRRKAERDAKRKNRKQTSERENAEGEETQKQLRAAEERTTRLAQGLLREKRDRAIVEEARRQGFIDPTDALTDDIRADVDYDQDEDDPSDIDIDSDSVKDAVADLATKKKHLVGSGTPQERSGGKFRKKQRGGDDEPDEAALRESYPSLN